MDSWIQVSLRVVIIVRRGSWIEKGAVYNTFIAMVMNRFRTNAP